MSCKLNGEKAFFILMFCANSTENPRGTKENYKALWSFSHNHWRFHVTEKGETVLIHFFSPVAQISFRFASATFSVQNEQTFHVNQKTHKFA